jgi:hypothetical protein
MFSAAVPSGRPPEISDAGLSRRHAPVTPCAGTKNAIGLDREKDAKEIESYRRSFVMNFHVSTRLDDIYLDATLDKAEEALERAKAWTSASLGEVLIIHDGKTYTVQEFSIIVDNDGNSPLKEGDAG